MKAEIEIFTFTPAQAEAILRHVQHGGAGLITRPEMLRNIKRDTGITDFFNDDGKPLADNFA